MVERRIKSVLIIIVATALFFLAQPGHVAAQSCPPTSYLLGQPADTSPSDTNFCAYNLWAVSIEDNTSGYHPCAQRVSTYIPVGVNVSHHVDIVPPATLYMSQLARFRALVWLGNSGSVLPGGFDISDGVLRIDYYDSAGDWYSSSEAELGNYQVVNTWVPGTIYGRAYYNVYLINTTLATDDGNGGFFTVTLRFPHEDYRLMYWKLASVRIGAADDYLEPYCPIPNADLPAETPQPTATVAATWTPHATPTAMTTPWPTSSGTTPWPTWTQTPFFFPEVLAENTPTPFPPVQLAPIVWPTIPTLPAQVSTPTATPDSPTATPGASNTDIIQTIQAQWGAPVEWAEESGETTGVGPPEQVAAALVENVALPVSYARGIMAFTPNAAPYVAWMLIIAGWVGFSIVAKFGAGLFRMLFELIRRVWEALPLN